MPPVVTVEEVIQWAHALTPLEKLKVIEHLTPDLAEALAPGSSIPLNRIVQTEDDAYQAGYKNHPEDIGDIEALLPHLALVMEKWE